MDTNFITKLVNPFAPKIGRLVHFHLAGGYRDPKIEDLHRENICFIYSTLLEDWDNRGSGQSCPRAVQTEAHLHKIESDLQQWTAAVQNYELFKKTTSPLYEAFNLARRSSEAWSSTSQLATRLKASRDPSGNNDPVLRQHEVLAEWRENLGESIFERKVQRPLPTDEIHQFILRILVAVFGGLSLVVPMLIISIHPSLTKSLVTTSAFVIAFGMGMAIFVQEAEYKDLLASTAAYAAVLVVFVGVGGGS